METANPFGAFLAVPVVPDDIGFFELDGGRLYAVREETADRLTIYRAGSTIGESWLATVHDRDGITPTLALRSAASLWDNAFQKRVLAEALKIYRQRRLPAPGDPWTETS